MQSIAYIA